MHLLVSGLFGDRFTRLHPAVPGRRCLVFSNNPALREEAARTGWEFRAVPGLPLAADERTASQQSKYAKYLQFLHDDPDFAGVSAVTYFDHKFRVAEEHVAWILAAIRPGKAILLRDTPKLKQCLADEIAPAIRQPRYAANMARTQAWIAAMQAAEGISETVRIMNTGLIHYADIARAMPLADRVHRTVWQLGQPECQIIWAVLAQRHEAMIQRVAWAALAPEWRAP